jgi:rSAM/selenodomain-associated transferase 2
VSQEFRPPPSISIIVPVLNEAAMIEQCLSGLRERARGAEIIVVDGGSSDVTEERTRGLCDRFLRAPRGRAAQMNSGARIASGDVLWFLHADAKTPPRSLETIDCALRDASVVGGFFRIRIARTSWVYRLTDVFAHYAGLLLRMRFGDHGFFCRRAIFEKISGYPDVPLMEDAEFFRHLRQAGRLAIIPLPLIVSPRRYEQIGPLRLTLSYGLIAALYAFKFPLPLLARIYRRICCRE